MSDEEKVLRVSTENEFVYEIPARMIAEDRADYYATKDAEDGADYDEVYGQEIEYAMENPSLITEWAFNNMNWADVEDDAELVEEPSPEMKNWTNADGEVVTKN